MPTERSSRRDRSRDPEDNAGSETGARLRRSMRSMVADSDGADTDASSAGHRSDEPQHRLGRRSRARKAVEDARKSLRSTEDRHIAHFGNEDDEVDDNNREQTDVRGRQRSLSNLSNTSSVSASSLNSESLAGNQCRTRIDQQLAELEQKKKMVEDGTLAEFCRRVAAFKEERNRLLQTAELHKNLQLKNGQDLYKFEVQRAYHLWENDQKEYKDKLLINLDTIMAKLQAEMKALCDIKEIVTTNRSKSKQTVESSNADNVSVHVATIKERTNASNVNVEPKQEEGEVLEPHATPDRQLIVKRRKIGSSAKADAFKIPKGMECLPFNEIRADIEAIVSDRNKAAQATADHLLNNNKVPFNLERRRLFCGKNIFEEGDEVHVLVPHMQEDYRGNISSITSDAIYIKLISGQKVRILLPYIEHRRCELKPALRGSSSAGILQSMGWTEYNTLY